jgi:hypothetical protein
MHFYYILLYRNSAKFSKKINKYMSSKYKSCQIRGKIYFALQINNKKSFIKLMLWEK